VPAPQTSPHIAFTQALPVSHAVQSTPSCVPHAFDELLPTQIPLQRWNPVLQCCTHAPCALQVTVPLSGASHTVQLLPHELMLVLLLTVQVRLAPVPHWWYPVLQPTPQAVPTQVGLPLGGSTQAVHPLAVQPEAVLLFATHDVGAVDGQPW
jgi:hypothetical protein